MPCCTCLQGVEPPADASMGRHVSKARIRAGGTTGPGCITKKIRTYATQEQFSRCKVLRDLPRRNASKVEGGACPTFVVILAQLSQASSAAVLKH